MRKIKSFRWPEDRKSGKSIGERFLYSPFGDNRMPEMTATEKRRIQIKRLCIPIELDWEIRRTLFQSHFGDILEDLRC